MEPDCTNVCRGRTKYRYRIRASISIQSVGIYQSVRANLRLDRLSTQISHLSSQISLKNCHFCPDSVQTPVQAPVALHRTLSYIAQTMCTHHHSLSRPFSSGSSRIGFCALLFVTTLWLQGSLLWHDTAHVTHNHGASLLCDISVVAPETHWLNECAVIESQLTGSRLRIISETDEPVDLRPHAYYSRAPPFPAS